MKSSTSALNKVEEKEIVCKVESKKEKYLPVGDMVTNVEMSKVPPYVHTHTPSDTPTHTHT